MGLTRPRAHQVQDLDYKQTARAVTTSNITLSGGAPATVDGVSLALRDRILVTGQSTGSENGIYYVTTVGAGSNGTWARSLDADATGEVSAGMIIMVTEGTTYADTQWKLTTDDPITIGTTSLTFVRNGNAAYGTVAVSGEDSIVADTIGDTLTIVAGTNLALTTNASTDTLTITPSLTPSLTSLTATGNITGDNLLTGNVTVDDSGITATGNIQADMLINREQRFTTSNMMKFNQMYTGAASGSYFTNGEYQKVVTITPDGDSQNYQVVGRITAQNANETHTVYFNAALRSNTLPNLDFTVIYTEEYNGSRYIDPQLWTKETTTAGFIFAFKALATIYGTVTVDMDVIPRTSSQLDNVSVNTVQNSEQSSVDTGFTANDMTLVQRLQSTNTTVPGNLTVDGTITGNVTGDLTGDVTGDITGNVTGDVTGNVTGEVTGNVSGSAATATSATTAGTVTSNAQPNITSVGTLTSVTVTGNITGGNIVTSGSITDGTATISSGSITGGVAATFSGNVTSANVTVDDVLRIANDGDGLRMTGVGAFDNAGSNVFRIFATNEMRISANGDSGNAIFIDTSNNVTVNNDLAIAGLGNVNDSVIVGTGNVLTTTNVLTIDPTSQYVGINQSSPEVTLHMTGEGAQSSQIRMEQYNDTADAPDIRTRRFRGNIASPSDVNAGDYLFRINAEGYDGGANVSYHSLQFDVGANQAAGVMQIQTRDTGSTLATRFGVTQDGNVYFGNSAYTLPRTDGSANQVLVTDGSGSLQFANVTATTAETVTSNAQPNITSVGTLSSVTVSGNASAGNISTAGIITATGNITGGNIITTGTVDVDRLSLTSSQTTVSPLQLTANSLQDGVGALRIDGSQADIFLNPATATHTTVTFAVNDDQRLAFGMDNNSDFYITRRTGGSWYDDTFVIDRDTGELRYGYDVSVTGNITAAGLSYPTSDGTADQVLVTNGSGTLSFADASGGGATVSSDTSTNTNFLLYFASTTTGALTAVKQDSGLTYNPSTGLLTSAAFSGSGASLTALNGSNISTGTVAAARVATLNQNTTGTAGGLSSAVTVQLSGDVTGSATFTSAGDTANISTTIASNSVALGTDTTGNYVGTLTGGTGIASSGATTGEGVAHTLSVDLSELTDMTATMTGTDEFIVLDASADRRKAANEIGLSIFSNDAGFTTNTGDITNVAVSGTGLSGGGSSGSVTITSNATSANTASTIVARDASGDFSAGTITTSGGINATGNLDLQNGSIILGDSGSYEGLYLEDEKHAITWNDSFGNFNIRVGNNGLTDENCTEDGYIFHDEWSQSGGYRQFNISSASLSVGNSPTWRTQIQYSQNDVSLRYQGSQKLVTTSSGITVTGTMSGTATSAQYADLAEKYTSDADYEPGTVVELGGEQEVTQTRRSRSTAIAGIVSTNPAHLMNDQLESEHVVDVALIGRVPCKVVGKVRKGDLLISSDEPGHAQAYRDMHNPPTGSVIGKAIESKDNEDPGVIEVLVGRL